MRARPTTTQSSVGQRAAGQRRAGAAGDDLDPMRGEKFQDRRDLLGRGRQDDGERHGAVGGQRVGLVGAALVLGGDDAALAQNRREPGDDLVAGGKDP